MACDYLKDCENYGFSCYDVMRGNCPTCYKPKTTKRKDKTMENGTIINTEVAYGQKYKDKVSGFIGTAVAVTKWEHGCVRIGLQPAVDKDGKIDDPTWFDEKNLGKVDDSGAEKEAVSPVEDGPGGPTVNPKQNPDC